MDSLHQPAVLCPDELLAARAWFYPRAVEAVFVGQEVDREVSVRSQDAGQLTLKASQLFALQEILRGQ